MKLLYLAHRVPYPPDKGERVRAFQEIQALSDRFDVTVAAVARDDREVQAAGQLRKHCKDVIVSRGHRRSVWRAAGANLLRGRSLTEAYFYDRSFHRRLEAEAQCARFDVVMAYCSSMLQYARDLPCGARVMDLVDGDSLKWADYAQRSSGPRRWVYRREANAVGRLEREAIAACEGVVVSSSAEASALGLEGRVLVAGNGVDLEYFEFAPPARSESPSLVFTGSMDYYPNVQAVCWFAREVWPRLHQKVRDLSFKIVGRDPTAAVQALTKVPGIVVTGSVSDVRPYLREAAVAVVPLQIARGVQNKVLEAMAMGRAVVASSQALGGLDRVGHSVRRADNVDQWLQAITQLLCDESLRAKMGSLARKCVQHRYNWPAQMAPLVELCVRLAQSSGGYTRRHCLTDSVNNPTTLRAG